MTMTASAPGAAAPRAGDLSLPLRRFLADNLVRDRDLYGFDPADHERLVEKDMPWTRSKKFFTKVEMSALALVKMAAHARRGGKLEVMGLMVGRPTRDGRFIVTDCFALPVEGTETRVSAGDQADEYLVGFVDLAEQMGKKHVCCGWYHSHPGYGCWLSGIDVATQRAYQTGSEPWLAVVIDPKRTATAGRVEIGAFRVLRDHEQGLGVLDDSANVPVDKRADFGQHGSEYYELDIQVVRSSQDDSLLNALWRQYYADTLAKKAELGAEVLEQATQMALSAAEQRRRGGQTRRDDELTTAARLAGPGALKALSDVVGKDLVFLRQRERCRCGEHTMAEEAMRE